MICGNNDIPVLFRQTVARGALPSATRQAPPSSRFRNGLRLEKFDAVFLPFLYFSYFVNLLLFSTLLRSQFYTGSLPAPSTYTENLKFLVY